MMNPTKRKILKENNFLYSFVLIEEETSSRLKTDKMAEKTANTWLFKHKAVMKFLTVESEIPTENGHTLVTYNLYGEYLN